MSRILMVSLGLLALASCRTIPETGKAASSSTVTHVVVCWLKEPGNEAARAKLIQASQSLRSIPGLLDLRAGEVLPSQRQQVDSSFDVAVVMTFADKKSLLEYEKHPIHQQAVKDVLVPLVSRFVIYNFVERQQ